MKITVIHPSYGNHDEAFNCYYRWMSYASKDFQYILSLNSDDPKIDKYMLMYSKESVDVCLGVGGIVQAVNRAAQRATGDIIVCISDTSLCDMGWDYRLIDHVEGKEMFSLLTMSDTSSNGTIFIPIISKTLYDIMGYYFHPMFTVDYFDRYLYEECIRKYNCLMDCGNLKFSKRKTIDEKYLSDNQCDKFEEYSSKDRENFNYLSYLNGWNIRY